MKCAGLGNEIQYIKQAKEMKRCQIWLRGNIRKLVNHIMITWFINTPFVATQRNATDDDTGSLKCIIFHQLYVFLPPECSCGKTWATHTHTGPFKKAKSCFLGKSCCVFYRAACPLQHNHPFKPVDEMAKISI